MTARAISGVVLAACGLLVLARPARAACTVSTTPVTFGNYDVLVATPTDSTGVVTVLCTSRTTVRVELSVGSAPTFSPRTMKQGIQVLNYNLYQNSGHTTIWGNGTGGSSAFTATFNANVTTNRTIFGRIPARQDVAAGNYTDTVVVTIIF